MRHCPINHCSPRRAALIRCVTAALLVPWVVTACTSTGAPGSGTGGGSGGGSGSGSGGGSGGGFASPVVVERHAAAVTIAPGAAGTATASCATGEQMVGGGYQASAPGMTPFASYPSDTNTWTVQWHNAGSAALVVRAFAICLQASFSAGIVIATGTPDTGIAGTSEANSGAECPAGAVLTGGGFRLTPAANGYMWDLRPSHAAAAPNGWVAIAAATSGSVVVTPYALCATAGLANPASPHPNFPFTIAGMASGSSTASCPAGELLTDGGYWDTTDILPPDPVTQVHVDMDAPNFEAATPGSPVTSWQISGANVTSTPHTEAVWLVCLTVASSPPPTVPPTAAATVVLRASAQALVTAGNAGGAKASCQPGERLVGGGYNVLYLPYNQQATPLDSYPVGGTTWVVYVQAPSGGGGAEVISYADCLQTSAAVSVSTVTSSPATPTDAVGHASATASCPVGSVVTGGGYRLSAPLSGTDHLYRVAAQDINWVVAGAFPGHATSITAYALCATHVAAAPSDLDQVTMGARVPTGWATGDCTGGAHLTGGGFTTTDDANIFQEYDQPSDPGGANGIPITGWQSGGENLDSVPHDAVTVGICIQVLA